MSLFSQQIMERRRLDNEEVEDSYARLAASVAGTGRAPTFSLDDAAAAENDVLYYPILVNREDESWKRFLEEGLPHFLRGEFAGPYQQSLRDEFNADLSQNG